MGKFNLKILKSPWCSGLGAILGILIGVYLPNLALGLIPYGTAFMALLKMCAIPLLSTVVILSLFKLLKSSHLKLLINKMILYFSLSILFASLIGFAVSFVTFHKIDPSTKKAVADIVSDQDQIKVKHKHESGFLDLLISDNIFKSLSNGNNLAIMFFIILFGLALGSLSGIPIDSLLHNIEAVHLTFNKILSWIFYLLPLGVCCLFAKFYSQSGSSSLKLILDLVTYSFIGLSIGIMSLLVMYFLVFKKSFFKILSKLKLPIIISMSTSSSIAATPSVLDFLESRSNQDSSVSKIVFLIFTTFNGIGTIISYSIISLFILDLYNIPINLHSISLVILGTIIRSMSGAGIPGAASLSILGLIFKPLGIPMETAIALLIIVIPIIDPILTLCNVLGNTLISLVVEKSISYPKGDINLDEIMTLELEIDENINLKSKIE